VAAEPSRVTAAGLVRDTPTDRGRALVDRLSADAGARAAFLAACEAGAEAAVDRTDGLRVTLAEGRILHLRPSGNAPEMRLYTEAETPAAAQALLEAGLAALGRALDG